MLGFFSTELFCVLAKLVNSAIKLMMISYHIHVSLFFHDVGMCGLFNSILVPLQRFSGLDFSIEVRCLNQCSGIVLHNMQQQLKNAFIFCVKNMAQIHV